MADAKVNLLFIITKLELGGAQKHVLSLIRAMDKERFRLFLFTAKEGQLLTEALSIPGLTIKQSVYLKRPVDPVNDLLALFEIKKFIKENNIDIVHTHSSKAGIIGRLAAKFLKVKFIIHTVHGWPFNSYQPFALRAVYIRLERLCSGFCDKIIVVSEYDKQTGLAAAIGKPGQYELIHYGIDYKEFGESKYSGAREEFGIDKDDVLVGMIGCFKPQKAPLDFVRLASLVNKQNNKVKFILIGDGALRPDIEESVKMRDLFHMVKLTGWRRDIPSLLSAMDVFVLTSLWEGMPISILESMRLGLPVIATDTGGVAEIINDGVNGYLVPRGNVPGIYAKLDILLRDQGLRKQIGSCAKDSLGEKFRLENMVERTSAIYGLVK